MKKPVRKAVIAAAGFGTRFLPQTKAMPKEMLPLVDRPIIQKVVEELRAAGIVDIVIVTGYHKRTIEDHFDKVNSDLLHNLRVGQKTKLINQVNEISNLANFAYIRQKGPAGNGSPILDAAHYIGNEPFIYTFADDFIEVKPVRFKQLIDAYNEYGGSVLSCVTQDDDLDYGRYAYVDGAEVKPGLVDIAKIIEKPGSRKRAPSKLASVGGYVFDPILIQYLQRQKQTYDVSQGEFKFQDALQQMINDGHHVYGLEIKNGVFYDTGNPVSYLKTVFDFALKYPEIADELKSYLREKLSRLD